MADYNGVLLGAHVLVKKGNGAAPEVFTPFCAFSESLSYAFAVNNQSFETRGKNCGQPDALPKTMTRAGAESHTFTGDAHFGSEELFKESRELSRSQALTSYEIEVYAQAADGKLGALQLTMSGKMRLVTTYNADPGGPLVGSSTLTVDGDLIDAWAI